MKVDKKKLKNYIYEFEDYLRLIRKTNDINILKQMYIRLKEILPEFYYNGLMHSYYENIIKIVLECENFFNDQYLLNEKIEYMNIKKSNVLSKEETLNYLVDTTRKYLNSFCRYKNINDMSFESMCGYSSQKVKDLCDELNIESFLINITPGYLDESNLFNGSNFHYINIIKLENEYYLIDCTYKQFFKVGKTFLDRLGIINMSTPRVGAYMMMNDERMNLSKELLKRGYIKLNNENFKNYMDGFTISFRNGLYYEKTNDFTYTTSYNVNDYIKFLEEYDSQIMHEGYDVLGYQKEPLKNYNLDFKRK